MSQLEPPSASRVVLCDLDGVVWLAHEPISGAVEAISLLRRAGWRVTFVTNASFQTRQEVVSALGRIGIPAEGDVVTSAMATARLLSPGERVMVCGGLGLHDEARRRGAEVMYAHEWTPDVGAVDAVVVGLYRGLTYEALSNATRAVISGARFVASNTDPVYPTPHGPVPGGGSIVAAMTVASGVTPIVAGKPHRAMADLVQEMCGAVTRDSWWMVGDRRDTDGAFAELLGVRFGHVLSGTTQEAGGGDFVAPDLAAFAAHVAGGS